jgi:hypothetical protein
MTTFDEREKAFENKFALDEDLKFKALARRNKMIAEWAAAKLGITGQAVADYVKAVRKVDLAGKGGNNVFEKIKSDLAAKGINVTAAEIKKQMAEMLAQAVREIEGDKK